MINWIQWSWRKIFVYRSNVVFAHVSSFIVPIPYKMSSKTNTLADWPRQMFADVSGSVEQINQGRIIWLRFEVNCIHSLNVIGLVLLCRSNSELFAYNQIDIVIVNQ